MKYQSKPTEIEARQWNGEKYSIFISTGPLCAYDIIAWVNANGGEARYGHPTGDESTTWQSGPFIAVRTINGWDYAEPGHYIVMGSARFDIVVGTDLNGPAEQRRNFYPCDAETFESSWEAVKS